MRRNWRARALWAAAIGLLALLTAVPVAAAAAPGTISGTVTDAVTESGIAGVAVVAGNAEAEEFADTDSSGQYTITGLPEGDYEVSFLTWPHALDYVDQTYNNKAWWQWASAGLVHVTAEATISGIDAELQLGGQISGTVTRAADGMPLNEIRVCAHAYHDPEWFNEYECARSDASGHYALRGLETGSYKVEFSPTWEGADDDGFPAQFYSDSTTLTDGAWIDVTAPDATAGVDGHLGPSPEEPGNSGAAGGVSQVVPPTPSPAPPARPSRPALAVRLFAPKLSLRALVRKRAIPARCHLNHSGRCLVVATISAKDAKALGLKVKKPAKSLTIGRGKARLGRAGSARVKVKLSRKVLNALKGASKLRIRLTVTASGPGRKTTIRSVNLTARS